MMGARSFSSAMCTLAALGAGGCFGSNTTPDGGSDDAAYGVAPDLGALCTGNNDGVIARDELSFPVPASVGQSWVSAAHVVNGTLNGMPYAALDTYKISVDARGRAVLPFLAFDNTLRVHVDLTSTLPGGVSITRIQYLFFHECYG